MSTLCSGLKSAELNSIQDQINESRHRLSSIQAEIIRTLNEVSSLQNGKLTFHQNAQLQTLESLITVLYASRLQEKKIYGLLLAKEQALRGEFYGLCDSIVRYLHIDPNISYFFRARSKEAALFASPHEELKCNFSKSYFILSERVLI